MSALDYGDTLGAECGEHMLFGREVIEESSLADVGGFGDVCDGGFQETAVRKKLERRLKKAVSNFGAAAFAAAGRRRRRANPRTLAETDGIFIDL